MSDTPQRPRLLPEALRSPQFTSNEGIEDAAYRNIEEGMKRAAEGEHKTIISKRSSARRDALIVVSRAIARRAPFTAEMWTVDDADTLWAICDLLLLRQGQVIQPVDTTFQTGDVKGKMDVEAIDGAIRAG